MEERLAKALNDLNTARFQLVEKDAKIAELAAEVARIKANTSMQEMQVELKVKTAVLDMERKMIQVSREEFDKGFAYAQRTHSSLPLSRGPPQSAFLSGRSSGASSMSAGSEFDHAEPSV